MRLGLFVECIGIFSQPARSTSRSDVGRQADPPTEGQSCPEVCAALNFRAFHEKACQEATDVAVAGFRS